MVLHQSVIGIATLVGADKLHLNTKWARLCSLQCQRVKQMPTTTHSKAQWHYCYNCTGWLFWMPGWLLFCCFLPGADDAVKFFASPELKDAECLWQATVSPCGNGWPQKALQPLPGCCQACVNKQALLLCGGIGDQWFCNCQRISGCQVCITHVKACQLQLVAAILPCGLQKAFFPDANGMHWHCIKGCQLELKTRWYLTLLSGMGLLFYSMYCWH